MNLVQGNRAFWGAVCGVAAAAIWGGMYLVSDVVLNVLPPATLLLIRYCLALPVLWLVWYSAKNRQTIASADWPMVVLTAFVGFLVSLLVQFWGTKWSTGAAGAVITSATPAFIIVFAAWILQERAQMMQWLGLVLATIGVLVVSFFGRPVAEQSALHPLWGNILLMLAAISWALYSVLVKKLARTYSALTITCAVTAVGIGLMLPMALLEQRSYTVQLSAITPAVMWSLLYIGIFSTALAFWLWNKSFEWLPASTASLFFFAQPLVAALLSVWYLHQNLGLGLWGGAVLIIVGAILGMLPQKPKLKALEE